jgi:glycosyltransferase involved in cell wall biosynthesis
MAPSAPEAAVVVPAYEEADRLDRTLSALEGQGATVVVVAGGADHTAEVARQHAGADRVIPDERGDGPAAARNAGARAVDAEVVCFTDADTVVPPGWVDRHRAHYHRPEVVGVGGPLRPLDGDLSDRVAFRLLSDYWYRLSWPVGFVQASANNCSYRREPFLAAGGFDADLGFIEDTDASLRMRHVGEMVYDPLAHVHTSPRRQHDEGYLGLFLTYLQGYLRYALGLDPGDGYFRGW